MSISIENVKEIDNLTDLKTIANMKGISFNGNIGLKTLKDRIIEALKAEEQEKDEIVESYGLKAEDTQKMKNFKDELKEARNLEAELRKTKIIRILDNDQRFNHEAKTCTVNFTNSLVDLGQIAIPLNEKVEVMQGHINVLKEVKCMFHTYDEEEKTSVARKRNRYNIEYFDKDEIAKERAL